MSDPVVRPTVRVLLLARDGASDGAATRVLLFRAVDGYWFPPGGALEPAETFEQAAHRELKEETGRTSIELGPHVWNRRSVFEWRGDLIDFRERWYLACVSEAFALDIDGWTAEERIDIIDHRWWSLEELAAAIDPMVPRDLANLLRDLLSNGVPAEPVEVGV